MIKVLFFILSADIQIYVLQTPQNSKRLGTTAKDLVKALCHLRPEDRLGAGKNGLSDVARHSWFHKLNWSALRQR